MDFCVVLYYMCIKNIEKKYLKIRKNSSNKRCAVTGLPCVTPGMGFPSLGAITLQLLCCMKEAIIYHHSQITIFPTFYPFLY